MNFKNVKLFFIMILVAVNAYLLFGLAVSDKEHAQIDETTLNDLVDLLDTNGIELDKELIPREKLYSDIIKTDFDADYYERVAGDISVSEKESVNILPDNSIRLIMKNGDQFLLDRRFGFSFVSERRTQITADEFARLIASVKGSDMLGLTRSTLNKDEQKLVHDFLYPSSKAQTDDVFSFEASTVLQNGSSKILVCEQTVDGIAVSGHTMYLELEQTAVTRAAGTWFFPQNSEAYSYDLYDLPSILFKELEYKNDSNETCDDYEIEELYFTYCIYWNTRQDALFFIPAWKLVTKDGETRLYNAVNCELYE